MNDDPVVARRARIGRWVAIGKRVGYLALAVAIDVPRVPQFDRPPLFTRPLLDAHNCYPDEGRWADRIDRALATGLRPIAIEQDIAWAVAADGTGRSVVVHDDSPTGREPTLESYFFDKVRPHQVHRKMRFCSPLQCRVRGFKMPEMRGNRRAGGRG